MAPIATLTVRISAQIAELQKAFADANKSTATFQKNFAGMATAAATVGTFLGNVFTKIASSIVSTLGHAITDSVKYAQQFQNAFLGLSSVATAFGISSTDATAAAKKLSADGLIPLEHSAKGLKALLAKGFGLEDSVKLLNAFKDSAAFGRQSSLSLGEAVSSAAEGLKNHNNQLLDNAGMTKNLTPILKEAGYAMEDLDSKTKGAGARQAALAGILRETAAQAGDAAKLTKTYSGAVAAMDTAYVSLLASMGESITTNKGVQIALTAVSDAMRGVQSWIGENNKGFDIISKTLAGVIRVIANVIEAFDELQRIMANVDKNVRGSILNLVKGFSEVYVFLQKIEIQTQRPFRAMGGERGAEASRLIETAKGNIQAVEGFARKMEKEIAATQASSRALTGTLTPVVGKLRQVAQAIEDAEGQTIELGEATTPAKLDRGGLDALEKKTKKLKKEFPPLISLFAIADNVLDTFGARIEEIPMNIKKVGDLPAFDADWLLPNVKEQTAEATRVINTELSNLPTQIRPIFKDMFAELPNILRGVMTGGGGVVDVMLTAGAMAGAKFSESFGKALARSKTAGGAPLTGGEKALGLAGMGVDSFLGGYGMGAAGGKVKGALGGAASGAMSGAMMGAALGPGGMAIGAVIGGAAGLFGGLFGGSKKAKEERKALEANKRALLEQYGGMEKLRDTAGKLGVDISKAFSTKKPEEFTRVVERLNKAIEDQKKRIEGLNTALKGVNDRAAIFADKFTAVYEAANKPPAGDKLTDAEAQDRAKAAQKLQAMAQGSEAEFGRLGLMIRDTFAGLVKETGSGIAALQQMAPAFQMLEDGVSKWGITSTAVIDELRANFNLVNNEAFKPLFAQIASSGEVLRGLFDAKALSPEGFQAIATDIGLSIQGIVDRGGDMAKTLALSQPVLQTLWESQQQYGAITDDTTAAILAQAEQQGLVGAHMQDVNKQILDVLLAIGDVLGATLPDYFQRLKAPAADAAQSIENSFNNIQIDPIAVPVYVDGERLPDGISVPALAAGGIVRRPTLALIGESGPEAVVPLTGQALDVSGSYETTIYLDGERIARSSARRIPRIMREMGVGH